MAEWLKSSPCFYNKKLEDYRKTHMKQRLWKDKAAEFPNVDVAYLLGWYKSIRTRFGKLSKIPSGSGVQELTDQDASILTKFAFLKTHITRPRGTQLGGISIKNLLDLSNLFIFHIHMYQCCSFFFSTLNYSLPSVPQVQPPTHHPPPESLLFPPPFFPFFFFFFFFFFKSSIPL